MPPPVSSVCRSVVSARGDENEKKPFSPLVFQLNYKSKRKQHFSIRCLDNSYRCSLRNYTHVHEEEWLEKLGPCARAAAAARTHCAPTAEPGLSQYMQTLSGLRAYGLRHPRLRRRSASASLRIGVGIVASSP